MVRFAFLSSTCPQWTFQQMVDAAARLGYAGVDLRMEWGHAHGLELDSSQDARREARAYAAAQNVTISCLALSTRFAQESEAARLDAVEQVKRYAELASDLGSPFLRVFGGRVPEGRTVADLRPATAEYLGRAAEAAAEWGVTPCIETHDDHRDPHDIAWIVEHANSGNVGVVWHVSHHLRTGVPLEEGYNLLKPWIRHLHSGRGTAESLSNDEDYLRGAFALLNRDGFEGFAANEWIIKDHSEADPEQFLGEASRLLHSWNNDTSR